jgi:hypothetical protein
VRNPYEHIEVGLRRYASLKDFPYYYQCHLCGGEAFLLKDRPKPGEDFVKGDILQLNIIAGINNIVLCDVCFRPFIQETPPKIYAGNVKKRGD